MATDRDDRNGTDDTKGDDDTNKTEGKDTSLDEVNDDNFDADRAKRTIQAQREETKRLQHELTEKATKLSEYEKSKLTDQERLERERDEARAEAEKARGELKQRDVRDAVAKAAKGLRFRDPDDAHRFIDQDKLKIDDDGNITNAEELLTEVAKSKNYLVKGRQSADGGAGDDGNGRRETTNDVMNKALRSAVGH